MKFDLQNRIPRRDALKRLSAGTLLALGVWPGALRAGIFGGSGQRDFKFIVVNDLHYMDDECGHWLEGVVDQMKTNAAELCLIVGDVADDGKREHLGAAREIFRRLGIPIYPAIGNHDFITQTDCRAYLDAFPDRLNYSFEHRGWQFVGLDSSEGQHYQNTEVSGAVRFALSPGATTLAPMLIRGASVLLKRPGTACVSAITRGCCPPVWRPGRRPYGARSPS